MKSFDEIKKELRERIKIKQTELIESDINSEEYTNILNELELLNLEYGSTYLDLENAWDLLVSLVK